MNGITTYDFFNDEFENVFKSLGFMNKPLFARFETPNTKDLYPVSGWVKDGNNYSVVLRMVGIDPEDVKIETENYGLHVYGETETFGEKYSQDIKLGISKDIVAHIEEIKYNVKNGMCKIVLIMKKPEERKISINKIEE